MIRLVIKKKFYSYERIVFPHDNVHSRCDIVRYMRFFDIPDSMHMQKWDTVRTPITDLSVSDEKIRSSYSKEVRYEVRRAGREDIHYSVFDKLDTSNDSELLKDVIDRYYDFCDQINMPDLKKNLQSSEFYPMIENQNIIITKADFLNGWTYHVYQVDGQNALLWFSFSDYRKEDSNKSLAGWANRGLHDSDIMYFKNKGYLIYDWGNISSETEPNHIDKFKMGFGGELKTAYSCFVGKSVKGKLLIKLRGLKRKGK